MLQKICMSAIILLAAVNASVFSENLVSKNLGNVPLQSELSADELLERAVEAIAPAEKLDALQSLWFQGKTGKEDSEERAYASVLMAFPDEEAGGLYLHARVDLPSNEVIIRTLAGDRSQTTGIGSPAP